LAGKWYFPGCFVLHSAPCFKPESNSLLACQTAIVVRRRAGGLERILKIALAADTEKKDGTEMLPVEDFPGALWRVDIP
jgi:hypothetical protein